MRKESNTLIIAIVAILIIALIGFNFEKLAGGTVAIKDPAVVKVSPKFLNAGEYITVSVNPGSGCVNRIIGIYNDKDIRQATLQYTSGSYVKVCESFVERYKTSSSWKPKEEESGIFFVKVFDYGKEDYIKTSFTIKP